MNLEDERRLKFDVRLRNRRGWVNEEELRSYEASLPDVSKKIKTTDEGSRDDRTSGSEPSAPPA